MIPDDDRRQRLAYAIRVVMARQGLSPEDVAARIEPRRSAETIARWRRGQTVPSAVDVGPLARALGVRYELLVDPPAIPVPVYSIEEYLLPAAAAGLTEGLRRADQPPAHEGPAPPVLSPGRRPRGSAGAHE